MAVDRQEKRGTESRAVPYERGVLESTRLFPFPSHLAVISASRDFGPCRSIRLCYLRG